MGHRVVAILASKYYDLHTTQILVQNSVVQEMHSFKAKTLNLIFFYFSKTYLVSSIDN